MHSATIIPAEPRCTWLTQHRDDKSKSGATISHPVKELAEESKDRKLAGRQFWGSSSSYSAKILPDHQKV